MRNKVIVLCCELFDFLNFDGKILNSSCHDVINTKLKKVSKIARCNSGSKEVKNKSSNWTVRSIVACNFFALLFSHNAAFCSNWNVDANGNYSNPANWSAGVPNAVDAVANFPNIITLSRVVTLDISPTVGTLSFHAGPFAYAITPSPVTNTINMQGASPSITLDGTGPSNVNATVNINTSLNITSAVQLFFTKGITGNGNVNFNGTGFTIFQVTGCTYVGATNISSGTTATVVTNAFPTNTAVTLTGGTWSITGNNQSVGSIAGSGGSITLSGGAGSFLETGSDNTNTTFSGVISGSNMILRKIGSGIFTLTGTNTYTAGTTVLAGTLSISQDRNLGATPGSPTANVTLNNSTLQSTGTFSLNANRNISLSSTSSLDVTGSNVWTIPSSISGAGGLTKTNSGTLILTGTNSYGGVTTVNGGTLAITTDANLGAGASTLTLNAGTTLQANGSSSLSSHTISLGGAANIDTNNNPFTISSAIVGSGPLTKISAGTLTLNGANTYSSSTTITGGRLSVNGSIAGSSVSVLSGATLGGTGTINAPITNNGSIQPGNSIGTLTVTDQVTFVSGSNYTVEISPTTSDLINVIGAGVSIQPGVSLTVQPDIGMYPIIGENIYTIIQTTGGVGGTFSSIVNTLPLFQARVVYFGDFVDLIVSISPFVNHVGTSGNVGAVAQCLDNTPSSPGSDMDDIISQLIFIQDVSLLTNALNQMQPSLFKGFALSQENMSVAIRSTMSKRADILQQNACLRNSMRHAECATMVQNPTIDNPTNCEETSTRGLTLWFDALGNLSKQSKQSHEEGFHTASAGVVIGLDYQVANNFYLGISGAYSYTDIDWQKQAAEGDINSAYLSLYGAYSSRHFFINAILTGAHNEYFGKRKIKFLDVDRRARHSNSGNEGLAYLSMGGLFQLGKNYSLNPFISADYVYLHQNGFKEHGANSLNLRVKSSNSDYLRGEAGLNFNGCINREWGKWVPNLKFGVIREWRFKGQHYETEITGAGCTFTVSGLNPDRTLFAPGFSLTTLLCHEQLSLSIAYDGEFGKHFWDQNVNLQLGYSF